MTGVTQQIADKRKKGRTRLVAKNGKITVEKKRPESDADFIRIVHAATCLMDGRTSQYRAYRRLLTLLAFHFGGFPPDLFDIYLRPRKEIPQTRAKKPHYATIFPSDFEEDGEEF